MSSTHSPHVLHKYITNIIRQRWVRLTDWVVDTQVCKMRATYLHTCSLFFAFSVCISWLVCESCFSVFLNVFLLRYSTRCGFVHYARQAFDCSMIDHLFWCFIARLQTYNTRDRTYISISGIHFVGAPVWVGAWLVCQMISSFIFTQSFVKKSDYS